MKSDVRATSLIASATHFLVMASNFHFYLRNFFIMHPQIIDLFSNDSLLTDKYNSFIRKNEEITDHIQASTTVCHCESIGEAVERHLLA
jgi:hypothetical protein